ncbi:hypothetical protein GCK72_006086 [Caenorhabditis remanei]|uniref:Bromo domain-containing protein n=1 Tax=Caenorhabditis remanei TaxID=31234 RepID=A0A6A5HEB2_CAERE|nr:hypothetical protein GCK72_006086 [Caenorhabditis remanei]KAF1766130.1 hypothetical protein GCK72_006086 [Caenorhabditis remanei]
MAYRFGRSNWQDSDRLNLMKVCLKHASWNERLMELRTIYAEEKYHPAYFTEHACRDELERIIALPTPNVRIEVSPTFSYSRKLIMTKWAEYFESEVNKKKSAQTELSMVQVRNNLRLMQEAMDPNVSEERKAEILDMLLLEVEDQKDDGSFRRIVGSLTTAMEDILLDYDEESNFKTLVLPPTKEPDENMEDGTRGYLTPTHSASSFDMSFFSPPPPPTPQKPMRTMPEALRDAVPLADPEPEDVVIVPPIADLPDNILEPATTPPRRGLNAGQVEDKEGLADKVEAERDVGSVEDRKAERDEELPGKEEKEVEPEQEEVQEQKEKKDDTEDDKNNVQDEDEDEEILDQPTPSKKEVIPAQPITESEVSQKVHQSDRPPSPMDVDMKDIKEETEAQSPSDESPSEQIVSTPSSSLRSRGRPRLQSNASSTSTSNNTKKSEKAEASRDETPEAQLSQGKRRAQDRSQEPSTSSSAKKSRRGSVLPISSRKQSKDGEEPSLIEVFRQGVQTDIVIRRAVSATLNRKRAPQATEDPKRSASSASSTTPMRTTSPTGHPARNSSVGGYAFSDVGVQTNLRIEIEKHEVIELRVESCQSFRSMQIDSKNPIIVNMETCNEIDMENARLHENNDDMGKRPSKADGRREITFIIDSDDATGQQLIDEKSFQKASMAFDVPAGLSPIKRRDRNKVESMKVKLLALHRIIYDCEWAEAFKRPVPTTEAKYAIGVLDRVDLSLIKREIDSGKINNIPLFLLRCYRMLSNAVMFNGYDHDVCIQAKNIAKDIMPTIGVEQAEEKRFDNMSPSAGPSEERDVPSSRPSMELDSSSTINDSESSGMNSSRLQNVEGAVLASGGPTPTSTTQSEMDDLQFEDTGNLPLPSTMQQHLQMKLGKATDIQKTPSRGGLGMIVNESKTPGARSLQSLTSARKATSSVMKKTVPTNIGFEIFQDEQEDIVMEEQQPLKQKEIEKTPCSPIDTVDRYQKSDSLCDIIADDMLNWSDQDVVLFDEEPRSDFIDPKVVEAEEMAKLGVEEWDEYPPIDTASRIADDFNYPISLDEFKYEPDVELEEGDYPPITNAQEIEWNPEEWKKISDRLMESSYDVYDLIAEEAAIAEDAAIPI